MTKKLLPLVMAFALSVAPLPIMSVAHSALAVDFSPLVEKVSDGVVRVSISKPVSDEELAMAHQAQLLRQFFGNRVNVPDIPTIEYGYGTGFFVSSDGYILTNHHVVDGAKTITVTLKDRSELDAVLVGSDASSDIAVLKIKGKNYPALKVGNSTALKVGEPVLAIGSPFGFDYSASAGIVSAKSRNFSREAVVPFIQTDVALNQGNSGGPLFNQKGEVVGINSRIFSGTGGHMGLSFSIPIDMAMDIYGQIKATGKVSRAYFGVGLQDIDRNLAEAYGLARPQGALVTRIAPDSPAQRAGLRMGDVVLTFNGQNIVHASDLVMAINRAKPTDSFKLTVQRNKQSHTLQGKFDPSPQELTVKEKSDDKMRLGIRLKELTASENAMLARYDVSGGMVISTVETASLAERAGLQAGDIIISLNQHPTPNITAFGKALNSLPKQGVVTVSIIRNGAPAILGLRVG
ncbi:MAG: Do family serine endopeptidase [Moraxella sp.]|nr:Do family serine endopeptidase [Moraxella sp.]